MSDNMRTLRKRINELDDAFAKMAEAHGHVAECLRLVDVEETNTMSSASEIIANLQAERDRLAAVVEGVRGRCDVYRGMYEDKRGPLETLLGELNPAACAEAAFARGVIAAIEDITALTATPEPAADGGDDE